MRYNLIGSEEPLAGLLMKGELQGDECYSWCGVDPSGWRVPGRGQSRAFCDGPREASAWQDEHKESKKERGELPEKQLVLEVLVGSVFIRLPRELVEKNISFI